MSLKFLIVISGSEPGIPSRRGYSESSEIGLTMTSPSRRPNEMMIPENHSEVLNEDVSIYKVPYVWNNTADLHYLFSSCL